MAARLATTPNYFATHYSSDTQLMRRQFREFLVTSQFGCFTIGAMKDLEYEDVTGVLSEKDAPEGWIKMIEHGEVRGLRSPERNMITNLGDASRRGSVSHLPPHWRWGSKRKVRELRSAVFLLRQSFTRKVARMLHYGERPALELLTEIKTAAMQWRPVQNPRGRRFAFQFLNLEQFSTETCALCVRVQAALARRAWRGAGLPNRVGALGGNFNLLRSTKRGECVSHR